MKIELILKINTGAGLVLHLKKPDTRNLSDKEQEQTLEPLLVLGGACSGALAERRKAVERLSGERASGGTCLC